MTTDIATIGVAFDSSGVDKGKISLDNLAAAGARAETATNGITTASDKLSSALRIAAGAFAAIGISKYIQEAMSLSQRYGELGIVLDVISKNQGVLKKDVDAATAALQKQGISMIESRQTMAKVIQSNIDLSDALKLARLAQDAAVVGQMNSSQALDSMIHGITSAQTEVLRTIGINANFEQSYAKLAKELGVTTAALSEQQKMQARVNVVLEQAPALMGVYEASMENAGKMMRSTERLLENLKVKAGAVFDGAAITAVTIYTGVLKDLNTVIDDMAANGELKDWSHRIAVEFAGLADLVRVTTGQFGILFKMISDGFGKIKGGDFAGLTTVFLNTDKALKALYTDGEKYVDQVNKRIVVESMLTDKVTGANNSLMEHGKQTAAVTANTKNLTEAKRELTVQMLRQEESTRATIDLDRDVARVTESVMNEQEKYNQKLEELDRLKPYLSVETYNRALQKAQDELNKTSTVTRSTTDEVSQLWIQAGRNIQSSLANSIFDFFNGGLNNMVQNVKNTVLRIVSEFAALKLSQSIGLAGMFGGLSGSSSGATSVLSGSGGIGGALNMASIGSNLLSAGSSAFNTGFGATGLISRVGGMLPGSMGSFFGGMGVSGTQAAAQAGASALWGASGSSAAASMGSSFAAAAGPAIALIAVDQIGRLLAGDKKLGGAEMIPVIGGFMAALFGRGPLKQKETNLIGDFSSEGFSGITSTKFKAEGGAFRSSKVDRVMIDTDTGNLLNQYRGLVEGGISKVLDPFAREAAVAAVQLGKYLDDVTTSTAESMQKVGESLGKGKDAMEGFYYTINIASEKGKSLTDEQISGVLTDMADTMARHVIPNIDAFRKAGESAADAALRIGNEFDALVNASTVLGVSLGTARTVLQQSSIEGRTAFIEAAGGIDALNSKAQYFAANFLDGSEIIKRNSELLTEQMGELGLSTEMTKEDFKNLVQSFGQVNGVSEEMLIALLDIAPLFNEVKTAADAAGTSVGTLAEKLRLTNDEMIAVGTVLGNVGYSFDEIMQVLRDLPAEEITAFVQKMGGIEGLLNSSSSFAQNFLTGAELAQTKADYLAKQFADLGIRTDLTAQDFKNLVQGVGEFAGVSLETRAAAAALTGQFVELYGGTNQAAAGTNNLTDAVGGLNTVAPGAVASIQQLVTAGLNFGFTMQQVSQMISSSTQEQLNQAITNAGGISKVTQDSQFIKDNFMTPEQALAIDMQDLANQLVTVGASTQTTRAEFLKLIQTAQIGSQRFNDLNAIAPLFDSVYDRIETAAQAAANYVPPQPTIINQAQIDAANSALQTAESNLANARQQLASARQQEAGQIQQDIDRFKQLAKTLRDASKALSLSDLSPLTPGEKYNEAARQLNSLQAAAMRGDQEAMSQLPDAARSFLEASKLYQGQSTTAYQADFSKVQALLDTTAGKAETQLSVAQKQLDALGQINSSTLSVAQAVRDLASAQSAYDAAKSSIPDAIYSTPDTNAPIVPTMPTSGTLLTDINTSSSNVLAFPSDTQILDFVGSHWGDWKGIYDEAQKYKVSSARLASVTAGTQYQLAQSDISAWVQSQGLPAFERGTDMVRRGGLAVLHPAEAVTPANHMLEMAREIRELRREVAELRKDSNRNSSEARRVYIESNRENATMINDGVKSAGKTENWNNRLRRAVNAGK